MAVAVQVAAFIALLTLSGTMLMNHDTSASVAMRAFNAVQWAGTPVKTVCTYFLADDIQQRVRDATASLNSTVDAGQRRTDENFKLLFETLYNETLRRNDNHDATIKAIGDADAMARQRGEQIEEVRANFTAYKSRMRDPVVLLAMPIALVMCDGSVKATLAVWGWYCFCAHILDPLPMAPYFVYPILFVFIVLCTFSTEFASRIDSTCRQVARCTRTGANKLWVTVRVQVQTPAQQTVVEQPAVNVAGGDADADTDAVGPANQPNVAADVRGQAPEPTAPVYLAPDEHQSQPQRRPRRSHGPVVAAARPPPPYHEQPAPNPFRRVREQYMAGADSGSENDYD